jgi:hypothetical protein
MLCIPRTLSRYIAGALAACSFLAAGCGKPADVTPVDAPAVKATPAVAKVTGAPIVTTASTTTPPQVDPKAAAETAGDKPTTPTPADDAEKPAVAAYQPPFPDRVDLFVPPKRVGGVRMKEGDTEEAIELLGFVRVDRPKVVLSINGEVHPIYEGGSQFGIEVISIQPPKVVLQRGRQRWQASLEN